MNSAMAQYRTYQPAPRGPPAGPMRRGQIPPSQAAAHQNAMMRQQHPAQEQAQLVNQRAKKPTDRNIPERTEEISIGEGVDEYKRMRELERRLDALMMRKMMDLTEKKTPSTERRRKLRIWITNTVEGQPWQSSEFDENNFDFSSSNSNARFKMSIVGKLLDDDEQIVEEEPKNEDAMEQDGDEGKEADKPSSSVPKLSHFFKSIRVEVDRPRNLQPDQSTLMEWKKPNTPQNLPNPPREADFDTLQFERKGDENLQCTIHFTRDETPERFLLDKPLANLIDAEEASKDDIISQIWEYAKAMELQQDEDKRMIQCDENLRAIFNKDTFRFPELGHLILSHVTELPPIKLPYTVRVDQDFHKNPVPTIYDVLVPGPDTLNQMKQAVIQNPETAAAWRQLAGFDDQLASIVQAIADSKSRHSFFTEMGKDPTTFIRKWISSQKRDLEVILADSRYGSGTEFTAPEFRRGGETGVWGSQTVRESVGLMVASRK